MLFVLAPEILVLIGIAGGILGVVLYFPQILRAYQTKSTSDIAWGTYILILINDCLWSVYGLGADNPVIYAPNLISICLSITILLQKKRYDLIARRLG